MVQNSTIDYDEPGYVAYDAKYDHVYVADTLRNRVIVLDGLDISMYNDVIQYAAEYQPTRYSLDAGERLFVVALYSTVIAQQDEIFVYKIRNGNSSVFS